MVALWVGNTSYTKRCVYPPQKKKKLEILSQSQTIDHVLTKKGMDHVSADMGLMFTAYNLRLQLSIVGEKALREQHLAALLSLVLSATKRVFKVFNRFWAHGQNIASFPLPILNFA